MKSEVFADICSRERDLPPDVLEETLLLAVEIAREGREGRKIGTLFVIGDCEQVLRHSRPLILDPLQGHADDVKRITDPEVRETLKELAQLDGAFVVSEEGVVHSAARYIDVQADDVSVPLGLGSRHIAAASITRQTRAVAVVVSESAIVRVFDDGKLVSEIIPELWMLRRYGWQALGERVRQRSQDDVTVVTRAD